jgi:hypothetical protein
MNTTHGDFHRQLINVETYRSDLHSATCHVLYTVYSDVTSPASRTSDIVPGQPQPFRHGALSAHLLILFDFEGTGDS